MWEKNFPRALELQLKAREILKKNEEMGEKGASRKEGGSVTHARKKTIVELEGRIEIGIGMVYCCGVVEVSDLEGAVMCMNEGLRLANEAEVSESIDRSD